MERVDLSFLGGGPAVAPCGEVVLFGEAYELRGVAVVEDFLVVLATVDELLDRAKDLEDLGPAGFLAARDRLLANLHGMIGRLLPGIPSEVLSRHFGTLEASQRLVLHLVALVRERAPAALKKNSAGTVTDPAGTMSAAEAGAGNAAGRTG